jgi:hypothetical protein
MNSRPRKTTLETFNEELAVLERPLEGDVEYYDERPRPRRGGSGAIIVAVVLLGAGGGYLYSRAQPAAGVATAAPAPVAAPLVAQVPVVAQIPVVAQVPVDDPPAPAAAAVATEPAAAAETTTANAPSKWRPPPSRAAWLKLRAGHRRHR